MRMSGWSEAVRRGEARYDNEIRIAGRRGGYRWGVEGGGMAGSSGKMSGGRWVRARVEARTRREQTDQSS